MKTSVACYLPDPQTMSEGWAELLEHVLALAPRYSVPVLDVVKHKNWENSQNLNLYSMAARIAGLANFSGTSNRSEGRKDDEGFKALADFYAEGIPSFIKGLQQDWHQVIIRNCAEYALTGAVNEKVKNELLQIVQDCSKQELTKKPLRLHYIWNEELLGRALRSLGGAIGDKQVRDALQRVIKDNPRSFVKNAALCALHGIVKRQDMLPIWHKHDAKIDATMLLHDPLELGGAIAHPLVREALLHLLQQKPQTSSFPGSKSETPVEFFAEEIINGEADFDLEVQGNRNYEMRLGELDALAGDTKKVLLAMQNDPEYMMDEEGYFEMGWEEKHLIADVKKKALKKALILALQNNYEDSEGLRRAAARVLATIVIDEKLKRALLYVLRNCEDPKVQMSAAYALKGAVADKEVKMALIHFLKNATTDEARLWTIDALKEAMNDDQVQRALLYTLLNNKDSVIRHEVADSLAMLLHDPGQKMLRYILYIATVTEASTALGDGFLSIRSEHYQEIALELTALSDRNRRKADLTALLLALGGPVSMECSLSLALTLVPEVKMSPFGNYINSLADLHHCTWEEFLQDRELLSLAWNMWRKQFPA